MPVAPPSKIRAHRHSHINNRHGHPLDSSTIRVLIPLASTPIAGLLSVILLASIFDYSLADVTDGLVLRRDVLSAKLGPMQTSLSYCSASARWIGLLHVVLAYSRFDRLVNLNVFQPTISVVFLSSWNVLEFPPYMSSISKQLC